MKENIERKLADLWSCVEFTHNFASAQLTIKSRYKRGNSVARLYYHFGITDACLWDLVSKSSMPPFYLIRYPV